MATSLYDFSVGTYKRILKATSGFMAKAREHFESNDTDLQEIVETRLHPDMMPFHFQIVSVVHHSNGAINGLAAGEFSPPSFAIDKSFEELESMVEDALANLESITEDDIDSYHDKEILFKIGERSMPFNAEHFLMSFSMPNFYFHATTAYDILRMKGAPLGKRDFMGKMVTKTIGE
ncbi:MAG: DUF1993 domain-containing protein [bacterium]|nr:DUF1993 domain-containing protein [Gammaproteobacteria bacterium]HIL98775.1 DUF1993 domain-containing protein [Pseudomonadales bacterium]